MVKWSRIKTLLILSLLFLFVTNVSARSAESISAFSMSYARIIMLLNGASVLLLKYTQA